MFRPRRSDDAITIERRRRDEYDLRFSTIAVAVAVAVILDIIAVVVLVVTAGIQGGEQAQ